MAAAASDDFSRYGAPSAEWKALEPNLPAPPPKDTPLETLKAQNNDGREVLAAAGFEPLASRVLTHDHAIPTQDGAVLQARTYRPVTSSASGGERLPVYVHLHGGGFFFGTLASEDGICARIALDVGCVVLNVNYRHTPEHLYPTAWLDARDALVWLHAHLSRVGGDPDRVVVGGISAGAHLTASLMVARHLRLPGFEGLADLPAPAGQILMIPCVANPDCRGPEIRVAEEGGKGSYEQCKDAPILPVSRIRFFINELRAQDPNPQDFLLNPGNTPPEKVKGLPPAVFGVAGMDPLRDEGLLYAKKLTENGVATDVHVFPGLPHGFRRFGDKLSESRRWDEVMNAGIKWALSNPKASGKFSIKDA